MPEIAEHDDQEINLSYIQLRRMKLVKMMIRRSILVVASSDAYNS